MTLRQEKIRAQLGDLNCQLASDLDAEQQQFILEELLEDEFEVVFVELIGICLAHPSLATPAVIDAMVSLRPEIMMAPDGLALYEEWTRHFAASN